MTTTTPNLGYDRHGDSLIAAREAIEAAIREHHFPELIVETVTDDVGKHTVLRCPRCFSIIDDDSLFAISPGDHWAPLAELDTHGSRLMFDASEPAELGVTLYYEHGDIGGHAVSLPDGWNEWWL